MLSRLFRDFQGDIVAIPGRLIALIFFVLLFFIPLFSPGTYILKMLIFTNMFVIFAVSWDFISGYTGQMNFGHALFFGVAAYVTAMLNRGAPLGPHWPMWAAGHLCGRPD